MRNEIIGWEFAEKLTSLPLNIKFRFSTIGWVLDLAGTDIDMVPRGLKGVDAVFFGVRRSPLFVAPDFQGMVSYLTKDLGIKNMTPEEINAAKYRYLKYKSFVESPRFFQRTGDGWGPSAGYLSGCTLPNKMKFYKENKKIYLDLKQTGIENCPDIKGVDEVIIPCDQKINYKALQKRKQR